MDKLKFKDGEHLSHAYIVASPSREARDSAAADLARALVCSGAGEKPCGVCRDCRKALAGIHPDVITVERRTDENGARKKEIYVEQVRGMIGDAYVLPNEAGRKVYVVKDADTMNPSAQNAALKMLEEPPASAAFILCAANPGMLLPTVRSRCEEIRVNAAEPGTDGEPAARAAEFIRLAAAGDRARLLSWCAKNESMDSKSALDFVEAASERLGDMLCLRAPDCGLSRKRMAELLELFYRCRDYLGANTGVKHVFGLLAVDAVPGGKDTND